MSIAANEYSLDADIDRYDRLPYTHNVPGYYISAGAKLSVVCSKILDYKEDDEEEEVNSSRGGRVSERNG